MALPLCDKTIPAPYPHGQTHANENGKISSPGLPYPLHQKSNDAPTPPTSPPTPLTKTADSAGGEEDSADGEISMAGRKIGWLGQNPKS